MSMTCDLKYLSQLYHAGWQSLTKMMCHCRAQKKPGHRRNKYWVRYNESVWKSPLLLPLRWRTNKRIYTIQKVIASFTFCRVAGAGRHLTSLGYPTVADCGVCLPQLQLTTRLCLTRQRLQQPRVEETNSHSTSSLSDTHFISGRWIIKGRPEILSSCLRIIRSYLTQEVYSSSHHRSHFTISAQHLNHKNTPISK